MSTNEVITEPIDRWLEKYKPIENTLSKSSGWEVNGKSILFETYGEELEFVQQQPHNHVWTWLDGDGGTFIGAGFSFVNRIGYLITETPWESLEDFVEVDTYEDDFEDD
jgi:hypothetical protein